MIGKLLGMLTSLAAAVCVATVIAAAALVVYYCQSWKVSRERCVQAIAILQGKPAESLVPPPPKKESTVEQPGYEQVLAAQGLKARDQEQREITLQANIRQFQEELNKIAEEKKRVQAIRDELKDKLEALNDAAKAKGIDDVRQTLQTLKPKQAKELLKQRLDKGDIDVVVKLLSEMSDSKRAKILAEFKTQSEMEQIGEVLNRIREGQPAVEQVDETNKKLQPPKGPGP